MTRYRRRKIEEALGYVADADRILHTCMEEESDQLDGLPEEDFKGLRGDQMRDTLKTLREITGLLGDAMDYLEEVSES